MVHRRELDGRELVFGVQGALWLNAMTWWDHETGSVWSQPLGEAIAGPLKGSRLELLPMQLTHWSTWRAAHPETLALDAPGRPSSFDLRQMVIVVELVDEAVAYPIPALRKYGVANDTVAGVDVAVVIDPNDEERWTVFSRRLDDRVVELQIVDGALIDAETGTEWHPASGVALEGLLAGTTLDQLPGFTAFPRDFRSFWPRGRLWEDG